MKIVLTTVAFDVATAGPVELAVYDLRKMVMLK